METGLDRREIPHAIHLQTLMILQSFTNRPVLLSTSAMLPEEEILDARS